MLIFLSKGQTVQQILVISATLMAAIRIISYYDEDAAKETAKLIPITVLGVFLVDPAYYSTAIVIERLYSIPSLMSLVVSYLFFIILLEWTLRVLHRIRVRVYEKK
jgi:hypothetical protein